MTHAHNDELRVGSAAPDFTVDSNLGRPVTLSSYRGNEHVVLYFGRAFT